MNDSNTIIPGKDIRIAERTRPSTPIEDAAQNAGALSIVPPPAQPKRIEFKRFPNGMALGWQENPAKPGTFVIHDGAGVPYGVALHSEVANLICQAVTFLLFKRDEAEAQRQAELAKLSDAAGSYTPQLDDTNNPTPADKGLHPADPSLIPNAP